MDITMPVMDGIKASQQVGKVSPSTRVLVLTQYEQEEYIKRVMNCGVSGYILNSSLVDDLTTAIRCFGPAFQHADRIYCHPALCGAVP